MCWNGGARNGTQFPEDAVWPFRQPADLFASRQPKVLRTCKSVSSTNPQVRQTEPHDVKQMASHMAAQVGLEAVY
jgi:hypothetical protein